MFAEYFRAVPTAARQFVHGVEILNHYYYENVSKKRCNIVMSGENLHLSVIV